MLISVQMVLKMAQTSSWVLLLSPYPIIISISIHYLSVRFAITKAVNYKPRFQISSGAPCALAGLFTSVQHFYKCWFITLWLYRINQFRRLHWISAGQCFYYNIRFVLRVKARTAPRHSAYDSQPSSLGLKCLYNERLDSLSFTTEGGGVTVPRDGNSDALLV